MTRMKKLASLLLAMVMAFALAAPAFAEGENTIYIEAPADMKDHSYTVFQIFKGKVASDNVSLTNIEWGRDAVPADIVAALKGITGLSSNYFDDEKLPADTTDAGVVAAALRPAKGKSADEKLIARALLGVMKGTGIGELKTAGAKLPVEPGYYLVKDIKDESEEQKTLNLLQVVGPVKITIKGSKAPSMYKKVKNAAGEWVDATDYKVGDEITFRLVATLPDGYNKDLTAYGLTFHDGLEDTLSFNKNKVTVKYYDKSKDEVDGNGNPSGEGHEVTGGDSGDWRLDSYAAGMKHEGTDTLCDFEVTIANLKQSTALKNLADGSLIVVEYTATLLDTAKIGAPGNLNTAWVTDTQNNKTPEDTVGVFTFKLGITKIDATDKHELTGAVFTLEKKNATDGWDVIDEFTAEQIQKKNDQGDLMTDSDGQPIMENEALFELKSLTAGEYRLTETQAPEGYTGLTSPIEFSVTPVYDETVTPPTLKMVTVETDNDEQQIGETSAGSGQLAGSITNYTGFQLPSTGGIGTTIFYILGGILVVGAAVLLITKRRMNANEE